MESAVSDSRCASSPPRQARLFIPPPPACCNPTAVALRHVFMLFHGTVRSTHTPLAKHVVIDISAAGAVMRPSSSRGPVSSASYAGLGLDNVPTSRGTRSTLRFPPLSEDLEVEFDNLPVEL